MHYSPCIPHQVSFNNSFALCQLFFHLHLKCFFGLFLCLGFKLQLSCWDLKYWLQWLHVGIFITSGKLDISSTTNESSMCGLSKNGYSKLEEKIGNVTTFAFHRFVPTAIVALECFNFVVKAH